MANGEHYFVDLLAALPFVCMVQNFCLWLNAPEGGNHLIAGVRSAAIFIGFLVFLVAAPSWMRTLPCSWLVSGFLVGHFLLEMRLWEKQGNVVLLTQPG